MKNLIPRKMKNLPMASNCSLMVQKKQLTVNIVFNKSSNKLVR